MKYSISEQLRNLCPNSIVQEIHQPFYEVELDFSNKEKEQEDFFNKSEDLLSNGEIITFIFTNTILPRANMASITHYDNEVKYYLSLTFYHNNWEQKVTLKKFIPDLLNECNRKGILASVEGEDDYGYYLLIKAVQKPDTTIARRLNSLSADITNIIDSLTEGN